MQHISNTHQYKENESIEDKGLDFEIRKNLVLCTRYFNHRINSFRKMMLKNQELFGKVSDYFFITKFQNRGNEHVHFMLWIKDTPIFGQCKNINIEDFIDKYISCDSTLLDEKLVKMQTHHHTKTVQKIQDIYVSI